MKALILAAQRTPIGSFLGAFKEVSAVELARGVASQLVSGIDRDDVADVIVGNVLQAGQGMNPARQIGLNAGLPQHVPGQTVNRVCGSGLQAIVSAVHSIVAGDGALYLAGGTESMSRAPYLVHKMRAGNKMGDVTMIDSLVSDGLTDPTHRYHMGMTAENVARIYGIGRAEQDEFALESHRRASAARAAGAFHDEIVAVEVPTRKGTQSVKEDENIRSDASLSSLAGLKPVFMTEEGTVTAGNASSLNDGAALCLVASDEYAKARGLQGIAEILGYATVGVDPAMMGLGPSAAIPKALARCGLALEDVDLFELNAAS